MNFKLKYKSIIKFSILLIMFIEARFMGLINIPDSLYIYMGTTSRVLVAILSIILAAICWLKYRGNYAFKNRFINRYFAVLTLSIAIVFIYTVIKYRNQSLFTTTKWAIQYFIPILFYPITLYLIKTDNADKLLKTINNFVLIYNIIFILQAFMFNTSGAIFLNEFVNTEALRGGLIRMSLSPFNMIMVLYNFNMIFEGSKENRILNIISFVIDLFAIIYVSRARSILIIPLLCMFIYLLVLLKNKRTILISMVLIIGVLVFVINTSYVSELIDSFISDELSISTLARTSAISYYWSVFLKSPLVGFGFVRSDTYFYLIHGNNGLAFIDDVGIFGQMATLGIFAFIIYIPIIVRMIHIARLTRNKFLMLISFYLVMTSFTLICLDSQRIIQLPFLMAISEYALCQVKRNTVRKT